MQAPPIIPPPIHPDQTQGNDPVGGRIWGWGVLLALMTGYILFAGFKGSDHSSGEPALSASVSGLLIGTALNLSVFGLLFGFGAWAAHPRASDLYAARPITLLTWVLSLLWSICLRMSIAIPLMIVAGIAMARDPERGIQQVQSIRPKLENLLDPSALGDPLYALLCITWVSFIVAGLREELWRAAMIGGIRAFAPASWSRRQAEWVGLAASSLLFGFAHLTQGWGAVALTTLIGIGLGLIQILRRSLAEAVIAHGLFDATTFAILAVLANPSLLKRLHLPPDLLQQMFNR